MNMRFNCFRQMRKSQYVKHISLLLIIMSLSLMFSYKHVIAQGDDGKGVKVKGGPPGAKLQATLDGKPSDPLKVIDNRPPIVPELTGDVQTPDPGVSGEELRWEATISNPSNEQALTGVWFDINFAGPDNEDGQESKSGFRPMEIRGFKEVPTEDKLVIGYRFKLDSLQPSEKVTVVFVEDSAHEGVTLAWLEGIGCDQGRLVGGDHFSEWGIQVEKPTIDLAVSLDNNRETVYAGVHHQTSFLVKNLGTGRAYDPVINIEVNETDQIDHEIYNNEQGYSKKIIAEYIKDLNISACIGFFNEEHNENFICTDELSSENVTSCERTDSGFRCSLEDFFSGKDTYLKAGESVRIVIEYTPELIDLIFKGVAETTSNETDITNNTGTINQSVDLPILEIDLVEQTPDSTGKYFVHSYSVRNKAVNAVARAVFFNVNSSSEIISLNNDNIEFIIKKVGQTPHLRFNGRSEIFDLHPGEERMFEVTLGFDIDGKTTVYSSVIVPRNDDLEEHSINDLSASIFSEFIPYADLYVDGPFEDTWEVNSGESLVIEFTIGNKGFVTQENVVLRLWAIGEAPDVNLSNFNRVYAISSHDKAKEIPCEVLFPVELPEDWSCDIGSLAPGEESIIRVEWTTPIKISDNTKENVIKFGAKVGYGLNESEEQVQVTEDNAWAGNVYVKEPDHADLIVQIEGNRENESIAWFGEVQTVGIKVVNKGDLPASDKELELSIKDSEGLGGVVDIKNVYLATDGNNGEQARKPCKPNPDGTYTCKLENISPGGETSIFVEWVPDKSKQKVDTEVWNYVINAEVKPYYAKAKDGTQSSTLVSPTKQEYHGKAMPRSAYADLYVVGEDIGEVKEGLYHHTELNIGNKGNVTQDNVELKITFEGEKPSVYKVYAESGGIETIWSKGKKNDDYAGSWVYGLGSIAPGSKATVGISWKAPMVITDFTKKKTVEIIAEVNPGLNESSPVNLTSNNYWKGTANIMKFAFVDLFVQAVYDKGEYNTAWMGEVDVVKFKLGNKGTLAQDNVVVELSMDGSVTTFEGGFELKNIYIATDGNNDEQGRKNFVKTSDNAWTCNLGTISPGGEQTLVVEWIPGKSDGEEWDFTFWVEIKAYDSSEQKGKMQVDNLKRLMGIATPR